MLNNKKKNSNPSAYKRTSGSLIASVLSTFRWLVFEYFQAAIVQMRGHETFNLCLVFFSLSGFG